YYLFLYSHDYNRHLHSFPTRRSSDLYGAQSLNYNLMGEYHYRNSFLKTNIAGGAVILAAVPDPYLLYGDSRNYNYGSGLSYRFRSEEHTSELQSRENLVCRLLLEKKK